MSPATLKLIFDIALIILLFGTCVFAYLLNNSLTKMRQGRAELEKLVKDLTITIQKADAAIQGMKETSKVCTSDIHYHVEMARSLSEELKMINESGNSLAERLVQLASNKGSEVAVADELKAPPRNTGSVTSKREEKVAAVADTPLATTKAPMPRPSASNRQPLGDRLAPSRASVKESSAAGTPAATTPIATPTPAAAAPTTGRAPLRSRAEQELMQMMANIRKNIGE